MLQDVCTFSLYKFGKNYSGSCKYSQTSSYILLSLYYNIYTVDLAKPKSRGPGPGCSKPNVTQGKQEF